MNLIKKVAAYFFTNPIELRACDALANDSCDGILLLDYGSPFPGMKVVAEWRQRGDHCELSWTQSGQLDVSVPKGTRTVPSSRFHEHIRHLDAMRTEDIRGLRGKDSPWYSVAWQSANGLVRSFTICGSLVPGPCAEAIERLVEDISNP